MTFDYAAAASLRLFATPDMPYIRGWNRLEGRPRTAEFARAMRAEVRDALWFLTRQWQFGEFQGEDAASPVEVRTLVRGAPFTRYAPGGAGPLPYQGDVPLETRVEGEAVGPDLTFHVQTSRYFFALVDAAIAAAPRRAAARALYLDPATYGLTDADVDGRRDADADQMLSLARSHLLNGAALIADAASGAHATNVDGFPGLSTTERAALKQAGMDLLAWFRRLYHVPDSADAAWAPRFLEYQFACAAQRPGSPQTVLVADQYEQGHLEWHAFDVDASTPAAIPPPDDPGPAAPTPNEHLLSFLPAPASYSGMPSPRYWEFENRKTEFADIDANTTDVAKLLLTEFALVYGNDWCVIPYVVDVGSLCEIPGVLVIDDFGETTLVHPAGRGPDDAWQRWSMFTLDTVGGTGEADQRLLLPPVLSTSTEGALLEQVLFLRDEMANMVWAVERVVPSALGGGTNGYDVARAAALPPSPPPPAAPALARYVLGTDVPHNWHPFIPVHVPGSNRSVQLQRARLPGPARDIYGHVLDVPAPYYVNEEEVPRAGKTVKRTFQRARWLDGRTFLWIGRRVTSGRGEGSSGLAFDQVVDVREGE
jgi:hypothetical protein